MIPKRRYRKQKMYYTAKLGSNVIKGVIDTDVDCFPAVSIQQQLDEELGEGIYINYHSKIDKSEFERFLRTKEGEYDEEVIHKRI